LFDEHFEERLILGREEIISVAALWGASDPSTSVPQGADASNVTRRKPSMTAPAMVAIMSRTDRVGCQGLRVSHEVLEIEA